MKLRIFLGFVFFAICVLALGRLIVQTARRPFGGLTRPVAGIPQFAS